MMGIDFNGCYHMERKRDFTFWYSTHKTVQKSIANLFRTCSKIEELEQMDLCELSHDGFADAVESMYSEAKYSNKSYTRLCMVGAYLRWCKKSDFNVNDDLFDYLEAERQKFKVGLIESPAHLLEMLDNVFCKAGSAEIDSIYRAFIWLTYMGLYEDEIYKLTARDFDFANRHVKTEYASYAIYAEAIMDLMMACHLTEFRYVNPTYNNPTTRKRASGDLIMRGFRGLIQVGSVRIKISHLSDGGFRVRLEELRMCGYCYAMYVRESAGLPTGMEAILEKILLHKHNDDDDPVRLRKNAQSSKETLRRFYVMWKDLCHHTN